MKNRLRAFLEKNRRYMPFVVFALVLVFTVWTKYASWQSNRWYPIKIGDYEYQVQVADSYLERGRGLMGRERLEPNQGMLFVFDEASVQSFWMKDTPEPLDIGFFDSKGVLFEIRSMQPDDLTPIRSSRPAKFALETPLGCAPSNAIGAKLIGP